MILGLALQGPGGIPAGAMQETGSICVAAAERAAKATGVPLRVLLALTLTETGRSQSGRLTPWPWALNEGGDGHWFDSREDALSYLKSATGGGTQNIDVGCFQLNYRWHGGAFASPEAMMDPDTNALYAARLIGGLQEETGDWLSAAAAYHSGTPEVAERYLARFTPIYEGLSGTQVATAETAEEAPRDNRFPLLKRGPARTDGSIVPLFAANGPLIGNP